MTDQVQIFDSGPSAPQTLGELNGKAESASVTEILELARSEFGEDLVMATGFGPSGIVLAHHVSRLSVPIPIFYVDTDLLFPSTYELRGSLERRLGLTFQRIHSGVSLAEQAATYGEELWARDPDRCCSLRKVTPLREFLEGKKAWVTGLRRDQSHERANTEVIERDDRNGVYKVNPLAWWSSADVWNHIVEHDLPYNELHDSGFPSIGCTPCTRRVGNGDGERAGRWPGMSKSECGIHERQEAA